MHDLERIQFWTFFSIILSGLFLTSPVQSAEGKLDDDLKGALLNNELSVEYQFNNGIALGFGLDRVGADLDYTSDDGKGRITDSYDGYLLYGSYYF